MPRPPMRRRRRTMRSHPPRAIGLNNPLRAASYGTQRMKITSICTIVAVLSLGSLGLQAKDKPCKAGKVADYKPEEVVKQFDKNNDGKLSLEEFSAMKKFQKDKDPAAAAKKAFEEADANK